MGKLTVTSKTIAELAEKLEERVEELKELQALFDGLIPNGLYLPKAPDVPSSIRTITALVSTLKEEVECAELKRDWGSSWKDKRRARGIIHEKSNGCSTVERQKKLST